MRLTITNESKTRKLKEADTTFVKITVTTAAKMFNNSETVYFLPNRVRLDNAWIKPFAVNLDMAQGKSFENIQNSYSFYNCNKETGTGIAYYREG